MNRITLCLIALLASSLLRADPWIDNWLQQATVTSPGYYSGQQRGYLSGGSFQARWKMGNDNFFTFQPPKITAGCGGIDAFGGGLSFMDPDYLVDKLQSVIQAAPAVAFDMAMKTMCKECSDTMKAMESITNKLNQLQMNDCQAAKAVASNMGFIAEPMGDALNVAAGKVNMALATVRNFHEHEEDVVAQNGVSTIDMNRAVESCSAEFRELFVNGGSVLGNVTNRLGFNAYADLLRGLIGDVIINYNALDRMYAVEVIDSCRENSIDSFDDFIEGSSQERGVGIGAACVDNTAIDINTWVTNQLNTIGTKIRDDAQPLTADETAFIDASPIPIHSTLTLGVKTNTLNHAVASLRDPLAISYAYHAIDDLYTQLNYLIDKAIQVSQKSNSVPGGDPNLCNPVVLNEAIVTVRDWRPKVENMRRAAKKHYTSELQALASYHTLIRSIAQQQEQINNELTRQVKN